MKKNIIEPLFFTLLVLGLGFFSILIYILIGSIFKNDDIIIKENSNYIYVKQYGLFNKDSAVNIFHKPIYFKGTVIEHERRFNGVLGKGGHYVYTTTIKGDNHYIYTSETSNWFNSTELNTIVEMKEEFYPYHKIYFSANNRWISGDINFNINAKKY